MKKIISLVLFFCVIKTHSQDISKIRQIDSLVTFINTSKFKIQQDTITQDLSSMGLFMKSYLTMVVDGSEIKKYVNKASTVTKENGISKEMISLNAFYYNHNSLIKVEEFIMEGERQGAASWYFWDNKPLYYTMRSDKSADRAELLLTMSSAMLKQIEQRLK